MSQLLLSRLREAKYKGVSFLVQNSNIVFGQKTVVHQYPNSNKTEVEFLGLAEDEFQLDIYVHGSTLIEKINKLKKVLSEDSAGILQHPYFGEITVAVVGRPSLVVNDIDFGIAKFSVTFQQYSEAKFPDTSLSSKAGILTRLNNFFNTVSSTFDNLTANYSFNAILNKTKVTDVLNTFDKALDITYKVADLASETKDQINDFKTKINNYSQVPSLLGTQFVNLYNSMFGIAVDTKEQMKMWQQFYTYGNNDRTRQRTTLKRIEHDDNYTTINNCQLACSLALSYATLTDIDFTNDVELAQYRQAVEDQYNLVIDNFENTVVETLNQLRQDTLSYLDSLDLSKVITVTTQPTSLLLLSFDNYGTIDRYDELYDLNTPFNPSFVQGQVKVLSNE